MIVDDHVEVSDLSMWINPSTHPREVSRGVAQQMFDRQLG